jgi:aminoglycoside phosphotransferase (APT) family kinase protein
MAIVQSKDLATTRKSLTDWLAKQLPDAAHVEISKLIVPAGSGFSNETFLFEASWVDAGTVRRRRLVARTQVAGPGLHQTYDVLMQASVMEAIKKHSDVPVPKILWKEEDPSLLGTPFFVMECVDGQVPPDDPPYTAEGWVLNLSPTQRATLYDNGLRVLAEVHSLDWDLLGLTCLARSLPGRDALEREITHLERYYAFAAGGREHPIVERSLEWIRANRPIEVEPVVLNWGDSRIGNMIFGTDLSVAACLDWELASLGSPEQDLGHWLCQSRLFTEGKGLPLPEGFPTRAETIARYVEHSRHEVKNADFYETMAALRSSLFRVRSASMMINAGLQPADTNMAENNAATRVLAHMIGLPAPAGVPTS